MENAPFASEVTLPSVTLAPPFSCCKTRVMLVSAGRKLLPVMVSCWPTLTVEGEAVSCGDVAESSLYVLAATIVEPMEAQTVYVPIGVVVGQRNQPLNAPLLMLPGCSDVDVTAV